MFDMPEGHQGSSQVPFECFRISESFDSIWEHSTTFRELNRLPVHLGHLERMLPLRTW